MYHYLYPNRQTPKTRQATVASPFSISSITDAELRNAVIQALNATSIHRMSPAWAVQYIYWETKIPGNSAADWAMRFLEMEPSAYSVRWDVSMDVWDSRAGIEFSGRDIAHICAYWIAKGFRFETHNIEQIPYSGQYADASDATDNPEAEDCDPGTYDFPLPVQGEIVRYLWLHERHGHVCLRFLDIRRIDGFARYEFAVKEKGIAKLIASSEHPVDRYLLEQQLYAGLLPITASAPCIIDSSLWLVHTNAARLLKFKPLVDALS